MRYNSQKYILLDLETTGLEPARHAILEIGAQILTPTLDVAEAPPFHTYVRPHDNAVIDDRALNVNKLWWAKDPNDPGYQKAAKPETAWEQFTAWLTQHFEVATWIVMVGWNIGFDENFLKGFFRHNIGGEPVTGQPPWPFHYHKIDLLGVVRFFDARMGLKRKSYKLADIAQQYYGVASKFAMHTALGDSDMCIKVAKAVEEEHHAFVAGTKA
jgi:DNA polymerase III epsilon subunit-like protein